MKLTNLSKNLIFLITVAMFAGNAYGDTEADTSTLVDVQPLIVINKDAALSKESGQITDSMNGTHSGLKAVFNITTNLTDEDYDFLILAKTFAEGTEVNAYTDNGALIFAKITADNSGLYPNSTDIANIKSGVGTNRNVMAYPVTLSLSGANAMQSEFKLNYKAYGNCYSFLINGNDSANVLFNVGENPVSGSFSQTLDEEGTYQAIVTLSVIAK